MTSCTAVSRRFVVLAACAAGLSAGCQVPVRPIRVGVTRSDLIGPNLLPRWEALRVDLGLYLGVGEYVHFEQGTPYQIGARLASGRNSFAIVNAVEYAEIAPRESDIILAAAVNRSGATERVGLIVTRADSPISSLAALKGKRFDFGPKNDPLLDTAAVCLLHKAGIELADIEKSPLLGHYYHLNSQEVAKAVVYEKVAGGIIDEADYKMWADTGGSALLGLVAKDQLRILARTEPVPEMVVLASKQTRPELVARVRKYFLEEVNKRKLTVLSWMGVEGFRPAHSETYAPFLRLVREVYLPVPQPDGQPDSQPGMQAAGN